MDQRHACFVSHIVRHSVTLLLAEKGKVKHVALNILNEHICDALGENVKTFRFVTAILRYFL